MDLSNLPADMKEFLSVFEKCVAEHPAAFNYLSAIKEKFLLKRTSINERARQAGRDTLYRFVEFGDVLVAAVEHPAPLRITP